MAVTTAPPPARTRRRSAMTQLTITELKLFTRGRAGVGLGVSVGDPAVAGDHLRQHPQLQDAGQGLRRTHHAGRVHTHPAGLRDGPAVARGHAGHPGQLPGAGIPAQAEDHSDGADPGAGRRTRGQAGRRRGHGGGDRRRSQDRVRRRGPTPDRRVHRRRPARRRRAGGHHDRLRPAGRGGGCRGQGRGPAAGAAPQAGLGAAGPARPADRGRRRRTRRRGAAAHRRAGRRRGHHDRQARLPPAAAR